MLICSDISVEQGERERVRKGGREGEINEAKQRGGYQTDILGLGRERQRDNNNKISNYIHFRRILDFSQIEL